MMIVVFWGPILGAEKSQVARRPVQSCPSGGQRRRGFCDLSMVAPLRSLPLPVPLVCLPAPKTRLNHIGWCTLSFEKVIKQKNTSLLEESPEERIWKTVPALLFKSTSSLLDVASTVTVNLVPGK